ncbi:AAA family ATPase [Vibrio splendidus]|uniref:AAA family ATPase n=1 Tax=Vibrio splendidus TaxID=29497 RepID=UPI000CC135EA|nr:AAA family ATPase [Vibrio splendidus]PMO67577.1 hypothetical protein BCT03_24410 [Vibrio splendidus]
MAFKILNVFFDGRNLPLSFDSRNSKTNNFTVIVGKNSTGKSRLLSSIVSSFEALNNTGRIQRVRSGFGRKSDQRLDEFYLNYILDDKPGSLEVHRGKCSYTGEFMFGSDLEQCLPSKIIATSTTPYDKFPLSRSRYKENDSEKYCYLGVRDRMGNHPSVSLLDRVIDSLFNASQFGVNKSEKIKGVFNFLGYMPRLTVKYQFDLSPNRFMSILNEDSLSFTDAQYNHPRLRRAIELVSKDAELFERVREAYFYLDSYFNDVRETSFNIDFDSALVVEQGYMFEQAALLRKLGFMRLSDVELYYDLESNYSTVSATDLSSGEQCIIATILGIASEIEDNALICIDEPEISLHPEWQEKYIDLLLQTFEIYKGCHFVIATHSPQVVSRIHGDNCVILKMNEGELLSSDDFYQKSADYQLVNVFSAPGTSNEYITRKCLTLITNLSSGTHTIEQIKIESKEIINMRTLLKDTDPVASLIDALSLALRSYE